MEEQSTHGFTNGLNIQWKYDALIAVYRYFINLDQRVWKIFVFYCTNYFYFTCTAACSPVASFLHIIYNSSDAPDIRSGRTCPAGHWILVVRPDRRTPVEVRSDRRTFFSCAPTRELIKYSSVTHHSVTLPSIFLQLLFSQPTSRLKIGQNLWPQGLLYFSLLRRNCGGNRVPKTRKKLSYKIDEFRLANKTADMYVEIHSPTRRPHHHQML